MDSSNPRAPEVPPVVDRAAFEAEIAALRVREKAHTREADAIAADRRRLPMVEVDAGLELLGPSGPLTLLDAFEGRRQLVAYYFMWNPGRPADQQCEGCTFYTSQLDRARLPALARHHVCGALCQGRNTAVRLRRRCGRPTPRAVVTGTSWDGICPGTRRSRHSTTLLGAREIGLFHIVCLPPRRATSVYETYWTRRRGVEALDNSYALMDLTVHGRQEPWETSPTGWPQDRTNTRSAAGAPDWPPVPEWPGGRPSAQWPRLAAGHPDDLGLAGPPGPPPGGPCCH